MKYHDLSDFCRLCLMPLNGSYIDCALDDYHELKETIKMVYNIDINTVDEYSTKVCLVCCDVLMYTTIHYVRAVEAQKSLSRVQRIKNKLRNFGKKKTEPKDKKRPLTEPLIIDVEMIDAEQNYPKVLPIDECEMEVTNEQAESTASKQLQLTAGTLQPNQWPSNEQPYAMANSVYSLPKPVADQKNIPKSSTSFYQLAKNFCGNMIKKPKPVATTIEHGLDEITNRMALLRCSSVLDVSNGY